MCVVLTVSTNMETHFPPLSMLGFGLVTLPETVNTCIACNCSSFLIYFKNFCLEPRLQGSYVHWSNFPFNMEEYVYIFHWYIDACVCVCVCVCVYVCVFKL